MPHTLRECRSKRHLSRFTLAILLCLLLALSYDDSSSLPSGSLRYTLSLPASPFTSTLLGPYSELLELELRAPLLWPGLQSGTQSSAHERESDFSSFLYAEQDRLYIFDQSGAVCLTRLFYGASGELADSETLRFFERAVLHVEVDGSTVLAAPAEAVFNGSLASALPPALASTLQAVFARGGNVLLAPLCAHQRLRLSFAFPLHAQQLRTAAQVLAQSDACVTEGSLCFLKLYFDQQYLRFPAALPPGWAAFDGGASPALPPGALLALGLPADPHDPTLLSGPHRLLRLQHSAADSALTQASCAVLSPEHPSHTLFLSPAPSSGTLLAVTAAFPAEPPLANSAHSRQLLLEAVWDGGRAAGGGELLTDLASLLGPPTMGYGEQATPTPPSQQYTLGTLVDAATGTSSFYLAFPAPFWRSANVTLRLSGSAEQLQQQQQLPLPLQVCSTALATGATPASSSQLAGYLQGASYDHFVARARENPLLLLSGAIGKLVAVTSTLEARRGEYPTSVVEGDMRVHVDGALAAWDSGYEDFFNGAHTYQWGANRTGQPLFAHQRRDTERWMTHASSSCIEAGGGGCGVWASKLHPDADLLSTRLLLLDAMPFHHSLAVHLEGFSGTYDMAQARGAVLYYGRPAPTPPAVLDTLHPAVEYYLPVQRRRHGYTLQLPPAGAVLLQRYDLTSAYAGGGEPPSAVDGSCPVLSTGHGAAGSSDYMSCPAPLLTLPVLALGHGVTASFTLAVDPAASHCMLRRTADAAYSVQGAALSVDGARLTQLGSSERAFAHLNTRWRLLGVHLPAAATAGKRSIRVQVAVSLDGGGGGQQQQPHLPCCAAGAGLERGAVAERVLLLLREGVHRTGYQVRVWFMYVLYRNASLYCCSCAQCTRA